MASVTSVLSRPIKALGSGPPAGRVRWRRRVDLILLALAVLLVGVVALIGAAVASNERVRSMWIGADMSATDGSARITEVMDYDFGTEQRHGIFQDVPELRSDAGVQVSSATAPDQFELVERDDAMTGIKIGDPDRTIGGRHRYRIGYSVGGVRTGDQIVWQAVGTGWPVAMRDVEIHLVAPVALTSNGCVSGSTGARLECVTTQPEPGHLVLRIDRIAAGSGVTVLATGGRALDGAPDLTPPAADLPAGGGGLLPPAGLAVAVALAAVVAMSVLVRLAGRERLGPDAAPGAALAAPDLAATDLAAPDLAGTGLAATDLAGTDLAGTDLPATDLAGTGPAGPGKERRVDSAKLAPLATIEGEPPPGLTPAQGGVLLAESVRPEHKAAWLIGAAAAGHLAIEGDGQQGTRLHRRRGPTSGEDRATRDLVKQAFSGRKSIWLGHYDPALAGAWQWLERDLTRWQRSSGLWDPAGDRRRRAALFLGSIAAVLGLAVVVGGSVAAVRGWPWQALVVAGAVVAGAGLAALIRSWELRIRMPAGSRLWLRTESFRQFLAQSQPDDADALARNGLLLPYTAWAVALGEETRWSWALTASTLASTDQEAVRYASLALYLSSTTHASTIKDSPRLFSHSFSSGGSWGSGGGSRSSGGGGWGVGGGGWGVGGGDWGGGGGGGHSGGGGGGGGSSSGGGGGSW